MCSPSPPPAPDYRGAAEEQGQANIEAARLAGRMNNPNVVNPYGSQTVTWEGDTPTLTQTLSPQEQAIYNINAGNREGMGNLAGQGIESLMGLIGSDVDFSGAPRAPESYRPGANLFVPNAPAAFDPASLGSMPQAYGGAQNLPEMPQVSEAIRSRVIEAMMSRANEDFGKQEEQNNADLVARGMMPGTKGYEAEMDRLNRARNDYRMQAEIGGGDAAAQAFGMDMSRRQQGYEEQTTDADMIYRQLMGIRQQGAGEQAQRFGQQLSGQAQNFSQQGQARELGSREQQQYYQQQQEARRQAITEMLAQRQIPLNEITALMSGSQVSNPFQVPNYAQNSQVAPAPIFGATTAQGQWDQNAYNQQTGSFNNMLSGLFGLGGAGIRRGLLG